MKDPSLTECEEGFLPWSDAKGRDSIANLTETSCTYATSVNQARAKIFTREDNGGWRAGGGGFKDATTGNGIDKNERGVDRREKGTDAIR